MEDHHHSSTMNQFPHPTRPINSYNLIPVDADCNLYSTEERSQFQSFDTSIPQSTAMATEEEEKQAIEDLLRVISEWYEKLPESIKGTINLEELNATTRSVNGGVQEIVHNFERFRATAVTLNSSRGLDGPEEEVVERLERFKVRTVKLGLNSSRGLDGPEEEVVEGLERFKVRTVKLGGVVEEEKRSQQA